MNDPNGLIYSDGVYHLFFQHNPYGTQWGHMSWGHAVSDDLLNWEELNIALEEEDDLMMFSGSAVLDTANTSGLGAAGSGPLILAYTGHSDSRQIQNQNLAFSNDGGQTFTKYTGNPVLDVGARDFRDPQVFWHEPTRRWIMVVGYRLRIGIYGSEDLIHWSPLSEFRPDIPDDSPSCECPQLLELSVDGDLDDTRWLLAMSIAGSATAGGSGMLYEVGHFDGRHFMVTDPSPEPKWVDHGADFFAAQSFSNLGRDRCVWLGWMSNWRYAGLTPTDTWRGSMSLPREVSLTERDDRVVLRQLPVGELEAIRQEPLHLDHTGSLRIEQPACDIIARLKPEGVGTCGIRLQSSRKAWTDIGYDSDSETLYVDRRRSGLVDFFDLFATITAAPLALRPGGVLDLRIVVDACSIEVFADDGTVVMTDLIFPESPDLRLEFFSSNQAGLFEATVYTLAEN